LENIKKYENDFFNLLLLGNRRECQKLVKEFRKSNLSIIVLYEEIFKKSLYKIGEMWEYNKISVSIEHMATSITEGLMNELLPEIMNLKRSDKNIVISCVENEEHQVGSKMVADIFEKSGWDTHYLGANTPIYELIKFCDAIKPDLICLSLSVYFNIHILLKEITEIRAVTNVPIIIGGQALKKVGVEISKKFIDVYYLANLEDVENYIKGCV